MDTVHNNNNVTDSSSIETVVTGDHVLDSSDDHSTEGIEHTVHREAAEETVHTETADDTLVGEKTGKHLDDGHLIQIKASNSEIERRIAAFIERKQNEVDENNRQEFCSVFPSVEVSEDSCARTEAVFVPRAGGKSHIKVTRVVNSYGPQTRALGLGQDVSPSKPPGKQERSTDGIDERLVNIETHLKMKGSSKTDVFSRLKVLEERVLFLESLSPEYFKTGPPAPKRQRTTTTNSSQANKIRPQTVELAALERLKKSPQSNNRRNVMATLAPSFLIGSSSFLQEMSLSEIEERMRSLRDTLMKKASRR